MGYACPVCGTPQSDAEHLANHLAFTAMLGDDDHEEWLDDHAPGWSEDGERELAERVAEHAEQAEFPQVFEDTTPHDHGHGDEPRGGDLFEDELERANTQGRGSMAGGAGAGSAGALDPEAQQILQEAQQMTGEMLDEEGEAESRDETEAGDETDAESADEDEKE